MITKYFVLFKLYLGSDVLKWQPEDGGFEMHLVSTVSEWICATATMSYVALLHEEFKYLSLTPIGLVWNDHNK